MAKMIGPDGVEHEITDEEFMKAMASEDARITGVQQILRDSETGEIVKTYDIPVDEDGSFDLFGGGLFGDMFGDHRDLEEKIADAEDGDVDTIDELAMLYLNGDALEGIHSSDDRVAYVVTQGKDAEDAIAIAEKALAKLTVITR